jgi:hypothetical protein
MARIRKRNDEGVWLATMVPVIGPERVVLGALTLLSVLLEI